jgi:hypothetical protein
MFSRSVKATSSERARALPGDELIPEAMGSLTHAITISRPRAEVWPWLAQMGAGSRAGWYSYDLLDNGGRRSAERILPELQNLPIGTLFPALPGFTEGFHLLQCEPGHHLVLGFRGAPEGAPITTWSFLLEETNQGCTRLIVRARAAHSRNSHRQPWWGGKRIIRLTHFIMQRKQLLGIARRVEESAPETKGNGRGREFEPSIDRPMAS